MASKSTIIFSTTLSRAAANEKGPQCRLVLPKNASAKLPSRRTTVEATINGFPFRSSLERNSKGNHYLQVNEAMRKAADADIGDKVTMEITRVEDEPETRVPTDLRKSLST